MGDQAGQGDTEPDEPDEEALRRLLEFVQDGVVSRRQLSDLDFQAHDIERMLRRRDLNRVFSGVYVDHTGPLTREQRERAAVLACWPAALAAESALPLPRRADAVHVAIDVRRSVRRLPGVVVHRTPHFDARVDFMKAPPRVQLPHAVLDAALAKSETAARFRVIADVCQTRQTSPAELAAALAARGRVPGRELLGDLLADLETGACSVLEREYLLLERRHGLPAADRQRVDRLASGVVYRDVPYEGYQVTVELDGRAFHDNAAARDRDFERDLDTQVETSSITVRLTYGQVFTRGCSTIRKVASLLSDRGWPGPFVSCPDCPD